jgi:uncharacterized protein DUF6493
MNLDQAISCSDSAVVEVLSRLSEKERNELAPTALKWFKSWWGNYGKDLEGVPHAVLSNTVTLAVLGTASLAQIKKQRVVGTYDPDLALRVLSDRRPEWLQDWAAWFLEEVPMRWSFVRRLEVEGLIEQPDTDDYVLGMIVAPQRCSPLDLLREDSELQREIPRLFQVEGGGENSLAAYDKYVKKDGWSEALQRLSASGEISRDQLLDDSLRALSLDFAPFRAGWYSRFHKALKPTLDERIERASAYLDLLGSQVGPTQTLALKALVKVAKKTRLDSEKLSRCLMNIWLSPTKSSAMLSLRLVNTLPSEDQSVHLQQALLHPHIDVVRKALERLRDTCPVPEGATRENLLGLTDEIPATLQPEWQAWLGETRQVEPIPRTELGGCPEFADIEPCQSGDEVCQLAAQIIEGIGSAWDVERCLDGMLRHRGRFQKQNALQKRAGQRLESGHPTAPLAAVILSWTGAMTELAAPSKVGDLRDFLLLRLVEINRLLQQQSQSRILLSLPRRDDGFVCERSLQSCLHLAPEQPVDFAQFLLRLPLTVDNVVVSGKRKWPWPFKRSSKLDVAQRAADEANFHRQGYEWDWEIRTRQYTYDGKSYTHRDLEVKVPQKTFSWREPNEDSLFWRRWESTVCPVGRKRWLLRGIRSVANNLDWWEADWADIVYLESLVASDRPWTHEEAILVSLGMACKESGQFGLSVEHAARALQWGGLKADVLGRALARCAGTGMIKMNRWANALQELGQLVDPGKVCLAADRLIAGTDVDLSRLLPVVAEIAASCQYKFCPEAIEHLEKYDGKGKAAYAATFLQGL